MKRNFGSFDEWSPLKEVVIGNVTHFHMQALDKVFLYIYGFLRNFQQKDSLKRKYQIAKKYITERQEDLDNLEKILTKQGIKVLRTEAIQPNKIITPSFSSLGNDCGCVRDMFY